jgi:flagellar hook-length control protein FliK
MAMDASIAPALPTPAAPAPGSPDPQAASPDSDTGRAFRALLGRHRGEKPAAPADAPVHTPPQGVAAGRGGTPAGRGPLDRADLRGDPVAAVPVDPAALAGEPSTTAAGDAPAADDDTPPTPTLDPALQHLLQPATLPAQAAPRALEATGRSAALADGAHGDRPALPGLPGLPGAGDSRRPATPPGQAQSAAAAQRAAIAGANDGPAAGTEPVAPAAADGASFAARLSEARGSAEPRTAGELPPAPLPGVAPTAPTANTNAAPAAAAPTASATLLAAPDSAAFPGEFGVQIATFAQGGIEHAELHLNPAEMGPVAVQIALDGTQARVELRADLAATRDVLQQSLPALAAALREAGLTLAGGSVSAQAGQGGSRGRGDGDDNGDGTDNGNRLGSHRAGRHDTVSPATARRTTRLGGVDLYA